MKSAVSRREPRSEMPLMMKSARLVCNEGISSANGVSLQMIFTPSRFAISFARSISSPTSWFVVGVANDNFVRERLRCGDNPAIGIHDAGATDQSGAILVPSLCDCDRPGGVHVGVGLSHELRMEGAQRRVFGGATVWIVSGGI